MGFRVCLADALRSAHEERRGTAEGARGWVEGGQDPFDHLMFGVEFFCFWVERWGSGPASGEEGSKGGWAPEAGPSRTRSAQGRTAGWGLGLRARVAGCKEGRSHFTTLFRVWSSEFEVEKFGVRRKRSWDTLVRKNNPLGPYSRTMLRVLQQSQGGGIFL